MSVLPRQWTSERLHVLVRDTAMGRHHPSYRAMKAAMEDDVSERDDFMEWVRSTHGAFSQGGGDINLREQEVRRLFTRLTRLRDAANECIEMLGWHADDDADPDNETPHDQTAHVNGLCRRILRDAVEGSEGP